MYCTLSNMASRCVVGLFSVLALWAGVCLRGSGVLGDTGGPAEGPAEGPVSGKLSTFATLHLSDVQHEAVHHSRTGAHRLVSFTAFERSFQLLLKARLGLFHPSAGGRAVKGKGEVGDIPLPWDKFYEGTVLGESDSYVHAHIDDRGILSAQIILQSEHYHIEPSRLHVNMSHDYHMIVYRSSDVKANTDRHLPSGLCEQITLAEEGAGHSAHRTLRQLPVGVADGESCSLHLIADHLFHRAVGGASISATVAYMTNVISMVDRVYRSTVWGGSGGREFRNIGVHIANVTVLTEAGGVGYNSAGSPEQEVVPHQLLAALSLADWSSYCLVHLFTFRRFTGSTLGVAYTAPPTSDGLGGVCSQYGPLQGGTLASTNVALSSLMDRETMLPTLATESLIIVAHELGHSFGSNHDPSTGGPCDPPRGRRAGQGKYLMHMAAVDGTEPNNLLFSPCSRSSVGVVLEARGAACFTGVMTQLCGNWLVEGDEECDSGPGGDKCCNDVCRLQSNASCSDANHACCQECLFAPSTVRCADNTTGVSCLSASNCTGTSGDCPPQSPVDGVECIGRGRCIRDGNTSTCQPFCETVSLEPCICPGAESECLLCCRGVAGGACEVYRFNSTSYQLDEGTLCSKGYCSKGVCIQAATDLGTRLIGLLTNLTANNLATFILENLVGCVLILSTTIWLLGLIIVKCILIPLWKKQLKSVFGVQFVRCCGVETSSVDVPMPSSLQPNTPMTPVRRQFSRSWSTSSGSSDHFYGKTKYATVPLPPITEEEVSRPPSTAEKVETAMLY